MNNIRQISMTKGNHRYVFKYKEGQEEELLELFGDKAADTEQDFDWYDAGYLSFRLGARIDENQTCF